MCAFMKWVETEAMPTTLAQIQFHVSCSLKRSDRGRSHVLHLENKMQTRQHRTFGNAN